MMIVRLTPRGILGLIIAALLAASMSTYSSYLLMAVNLFLAGTLVSAVYGIYFRKEKFGLLRPRNLGAYLAFTLGAFPVVWFFLPSHPPASQLGALSYALAMGGMVTGSVIHNLLAPRNKNDVCS